LTILRCIITAFVAIALSLQGVAAATMLHSRDTQGQSDAAVAVMHETASASAMPCDHGHAVASDVAMTSDQTKHAEHTGCAGALCCVALISQNLPTFHLPAARHALAPSVDYAVVRIDPATFDRPPRT